jgi:putative transposase
VSVHQAEFPIATMCRVLGISSSGYHAWTTRSPSRRAHSNAALTETVRTIHAMSRGTYGAPRVHAELAADGVRVGKNRVARLMRDAGVAGVSRRKFAVTTVRDGGRQAPDLVDRTFTADAPNVLWVADITYVPTWAGFLYLAVVLDVFSRRIVGWSMSTTLHVTIVLDALSMALAMRRPRGVIHHSDQGSQYTSIEFGNRCRAAGVRPSMGSVGDAYDNAMAESFFATLECELLDRRPFTTQPEARSAVFEFIEGFYNPRRRHSSLGYLSPVEFERHHQELPASPSALHPAAVLGSVKDKPSRARKCASLTDPVRAAIDKHGPGRRNRLLKPNKETVRKEESGPRALNPGLDSQCPHIRMGTSKKKKQEKEDAMTSDAVA